MSNQTTLASEELQIRNVLKSRKATYGCYEHNAYVSQNLKDILYERYKDNLSKVHREALEMICHKMSRIVNGDPDYVDSWVDIIGYAQLVVDYIEEK